MLKVLGGLGLGLGLADGGLSSRPVKFCLHEGFESFRRDSEEGFSIEGQAPGI